ncbi:MAG: MBL fold metallo-hydrolase [Lachnospiraceae bacterium]|nr:MBL fold metallo-hydrolase [Lachnospiraceae bacterium]
MKKYRRSLIYSFILLLFAAVLPHSAKTVSATVNQTRIHFISINSPSDAILLESNGHYGMVDCGEDWAYPDGSDPKYPLVSGIDTTSGSEQQVIHYLKSVGVKKLDFIIATHTHSDHMGGVDDILYHFPVDRLYALEYDDSFLDYSVPNQTGWDNQYCYDNMIRAAKSTGVTLIQDNELASEDVRNFSLGEMQIELLNWQRPTNEDGSKTGASFNENCSCLVTKIEAYGKTALLTADIGDENQKTDADGNIIEDGTSTKIIKYLSGEPWPTAIPTPTPTPEATESPTPSATITESPVPSATVTESPVPSATVTESPVPSATVTESPVPDEVTDIPVPSAATDMPLSLDDSTDMEPVSYDSVLSDTQDSSNIPEAVYTASSSQDLAAQTASAPQDPAIQTASAPQEIPVYDTNVNNTPAQSDDEIEVSESDDHVFDVTKRSIDPQLSSKPLKIDLLKLNHHGRSSENPGYYLSALNPDIAIGTGYSGWVENTSEVDYLSNAQRYYTIGNSAAVVCTFSSSKISVNYSTLSEEIYAIDDSLYYFDNYGRTKSIGWVTYKGNQYYVIDKQGRVATGITSILGKTYCFDADGRLVKNQWHTDGGFFYYFGNDGAMLTDCWFDNYYIDANGHRVQDTPTATWQKNATGWWYQFADGSYAADKFLYINQSLYYFNKQGYMQTGFFQKNGSMYYGTTYGLATGWNKINNVWYHMDLTSRKIATSWLWLDNTWYYFSNAGVMQTNWQYINRTWYFLDASGSMKVGWLYNGGKWYYLQSSGAMKTGWLLLNNTWYYLSGSGAMQTNWQYIDRTWYFLDSSGSMKIGWLYNSGRWYYLQPSGAMKTGWLLLDGQWFYLSGSGAMVVSWQTINREKYYFNQSGLMQTGWVKLGNNWFYFSSGGPMQTGWIFLDNAWYYLQSNGVMASNTVINGYRLDSSGRWIH